MKNVSVTLYTRPNCTLCQEAYYLLLYLAETYPIELSTIDITTDPELELRFALEIPVVEVEGQIVATSFIDEGHLRSVFEERCSA